MPKAITQDWDEEDAFDGEDERPSRRARRPLPWLRMILFSSLCIAALVYFAKQDAGQAPSGQPKGVPSAVLVAPPPLWRPLPSAPALYGIEGRVAPVGIEAREHMSGGREDTLTFGSFGDIGYGRISLVQGFTEPARSFFVDIVRRAAEAGLSVTRDTPGRPVPTKFGPMEAGAVTLAGASEQTCQAFRFADPGASFAFQGWLCGSEAQPVEPGHIACLVDRITLRATDNPSVKAIFAKAEGQRLPACGTDERTSSIRGPGRP
ncbi:hypothetical protein [Microvirga subterranea]|uniref:Uncharacterized protein n=1 Tax=Microvirga subterranea TaxID=186651 RepID=A0A370HUV7_9HYPH|nr:hypothetical protein [Microvirga subterranea]RDI62292.1 hypothetical protein DES45_101560 [Microvirga subterranea]